MTLQPLRWITADYFYTCCRVVFCSAAAGAPPLPSRRSRSATSSVFSLPLQSPPPPPRAPSLIHPFTVRITGKLIKTQSAKCARCTFNLVHPESLICCEDRCARIFMHVLPSLFPPFPFWAFSSVKGSAYLPPTFLLTGLSIYLVYVHTLLFPLHLFLNLNGSDACCSLHATWS